MLLATSQLLQKLGRLLNFGKPLVDKTHGFLALLNICYGI